MVDLSLPKPTPFQPTYVVTEPITYKRLKRLQSTEVHFVVDGDKSKTSYFTLTGNASVDVSRFVAMYNGYDRKKHNCKVHVIQNGVEVGNYGETQIVGYGINSYTMFCLRHHLRHHHYSPGEIFAVGMMHEIYEHVSDNPIRTSEPTADEFAHVRHTRVRFQYGGIIDTVVLTGDLDLDILATQEVYARIQQTKSSHNQNSSLETIFIDNPALDADSIHHAPVNVHFGGIHYNVWCNDHKLVRNTHSVPQTDAVMLMHMIYAHGKKNSSDVKQDTPVAPRVKDFLDDPESTTEKACYELLKQIENIAHLYQRPEGVDFELEALKKKLSGEEEEMVTLKLPRRVYDTLVTLLSVQYQDLEKNTND